MEVEMQYNARVEQATAFGGRSCHRLMSYRSWPPNLLGALWRRLWLVVLVAVACAGTAFLVANSQIRKYEGVARLLYQQPTDVSNPTSSRSSIDPESMSIQLQSVSSTIDSPAVRDRVKTLLDGAGVARCGRGEEGRAARADLRVRLRS